jgi:integrase
MTGFMTRQTDKLSARQVQTAKEPGRIGDGRGLYLHIDEALNKRWVFVFQWRQKRKEMGLGSLLDVSLKEAREKRDEARKLVLSGVNPIDARKADRGAVTFGEYALETIETIKSEWSSAKTEKNWRDSLEKHAASIWNKPVDAVDQDDVLGVLRPIWTTTPVLAEKVRGRLERVLGAATAKKLRKGDNPATWKGNLEHLLAAKTELKEGHHRAMPFADLPAFVQRLGSSVGDRALLWTILNASRPGEARSAAPGEVKRDIWTVPPERMKGKKGKRREHRVPLSKQAVALHALLPVDGDWLFPGLKPDRPISAGTMDAALSRLGVDKIATVHGFRSSFKDWATETTDFPDSLSEAALAHITGDKAERAYRRGDVLIRRRALMQAWADYVLPEGLPAGIVG